MNYVTEKASVDFDPSVASRSDLVTAVERLGYRVVDGARGAGPAPTAPGARPARARRPSPMAEPRPPGSRVCPSAASAAVPPRPRCRRRIGPRAGRPAGGGCRRIGSGRRLTRDGRPAGTADRRRAAGRPGHRHVDDPRPEVRRLAVAQLRAGDPGRHRLRLAVPPGGVRQPAPRRHHDGHAGVDGRARRLRLVGLRPVLGRRRRHRHGRGVHADGLVRRRRGPGLPRGRRGGADLPAGRALRRGPGQAPGRGRHRGLARPGRQGRQRARPRRHRAAGGHRRAGGRDALPGPSRRDGGDRRRRRRGDVRGGPVAAHRRERAGRGRSRRRGRRRHRERRRTPRGRGHRRRRRHRPRPHRPAGRAGTDGQGPRAAAGRPHLGVVRPRRDRPRRRHPRWVARHRPRFR